MICRGVGRVIPTLFYCSILCQNIMNSSFMHVFTYSTLPPFLRQIIHWLNLTFPEPIIVFYGIAGPHQSSTCIILPELAPFYYLVNYEPSNLKYANFSLQSQKVLWAYWSFLTSTYSSDRIVISPRVSLLEWPYPLRSGAGSCCRCEISRAKMQIYTQIALISKWRL